MQPIEQGFVVLLVRLQVRRVNITRCRHFFSARVCLAARGGGPIIQRLFVWAKRTALLSFEVSYFFSQHLLSNESCHQTEGEVGGAGGGRDTHDFACLHCGTIDWPSRVHVLSPMIFGQSVFIPTGGTSECR